MWQKLISIIEKNERFIITSHIQPDCDALGSELALAEHLENLGKKASIINTDALPSTYQFLDPQQRIKQYSFKKHTKLINRADIIFVLDTSGSWERVGAVGKALQHTQAIKVCIDHHPDPTEFVDMAIVDTNAAATAELIFDLIVTMEGRLSPEMAQALYSAIITDTGNFRFPKTSPRTHHIAANLIKSDINPLYIYSQIYEQSLLGAVQVKGHIMESIKTTAKGQLAYYAVTQETLKAYGVKSADLDGVASLGQQIGGVRVSIFCREIPQARVKISLRSDGSIPINEIAMEYGGGGHPSAAGAIVSGKIEEVMAELVEKVETLLAQEGHTQ